MKRKFCLLCNKKFYPTGKNQKYCSKKCYRLTRKEYNRNWKQQHLNYDKNYKKKHKKQIKEYYKKICIDCDKEIFGHHKNIKRCKKCGNIKNLQNRRSYKGKNNPNFNNHILKGRFAGSKNPMFGKPSQSHNKKNTIVKHHIDLNKINNKKSNKIILTHSIHGKLHQRTYEYLVEIGLIRKYTKWFFKYKISNKERKLLKDIENKK